MPKVIIYKDNTELVKSVAEQSFNVLKDGLRQNNNAVWCLSGGSSPIAIYKYISKNFKDSLSWDKVFFILGDERCVPENNPDSNIRAIKISLLSYLKTDGPKVIYPKYSLNKDLMAKTYNSEIKELLSKPHTANIDLMFLGLGEDGHTLSLFPSNDADKSKQYAVKISNSPKPPSDRISLTYSTLMQVSNCFVIAGGDSKRDIYRKLSINKQAYPINKAISTIEASGGQVSWQIDEALVKN